jgi:hypothetical protein
MDPLRKKYWSFVCPVCLVPRRLSYSPEPTSGHLAQIALASVFFMLATWKWFAWKGLVMFVPLWTIFEILYRARTRAAITCSACGFDPVLHMVDNRKAIAEMKAHWQRKFEERGIPVVDGKVSERVAEKAADAPPPESEA